MKHFPPAPPPCAADGAATDADDDEDCFNASGSDAADNHATRREGHVTAVDEEMSESAKARHFPFPPSVVLDSSTNKGGGDGGHRQTTLGGAATVTARINYSFSSLRQKNVTPQRNRTFADAAAAQTPPLLKSSPDPNDSSEGFQSFTNIHRFEQRSTDVVGTLTTLNSLAASKLSSKSISSGSPNSSEMINIKSDSLSNQKINRTGTAAKPTSSPEPLHTHIRLDLILGITGGIVVILLMIACVIYKYRSREEGTYSLDVADNCDYEVCAGGSISNGRNARGKARAGVRTGGGKGSKKRSVREWYV